MKNIFLKEAQVKRVSVENIANQNNDIQDRPLKGSFTDDWIEITPDIVKNIEDYYLMAKNDLEDLNNTFRDYCIDEGFTTFDFSTEEEYGHTYASEDEYIFLDIISLDDVKKILKGTDDTEIIDLAAKYIFTTGVHIIDTKLSEMVHTEDWNKSYKLYKWFENILVGNAKGKEDYIKFLYDCANTALADACENEDDTECSIVANALIPSEPFFKKKK